jgi:uncharacterized membrane protein (DUF4010 family)
MDELVIFQKLGISLGLGLLVGLQREYADSQLAGIRTFPIITVFGSLCALLGQTFGGWIVGMGAVALAALVIVGNVLKMRAGDNDPGLTTEAAMLLMYAVGAYLVVGRASVAVAVGGGLAVLLSWKEQLHVLVHRFGPTDIKAIMQFVLITLVILPVLPDRSYGPYGAFNPHRSWLMVVLIVGISLGGYVAYKMLGQHAGTLLAGVLGGLISSTATTVTSARQVRAAPDSTVLGAVVIMIASTIAFARVIAEIAVVAPAASGSMIPPLAVMGVWMAILSLGLYFLARQESEEMPPPRNPAELHSALIFGALYALVMLAIAAAQDWFGTTGVYGVAVLSGLHDMDAITLSTSQLVESDQMESPTGWRVILTAALSNLVFKAGIAGMLGSRRLFVWVVMLYGAGFLTALALMILWPG